MKVTLYLWLPNSGPTQVCQNVTGHGLSASAHGLQDSGELHSSTERGQFFPSLYSWCGAFNANAFIITVYGQADIYEKHKNSTQHWLFKVASKVRVNLGEECHSAHFPNLEMMILLIQV